MIFDNLTYFTAFLIGISNSAHCLSMCGSIITILSITTNKYIYVFIYNVGRILGYVSITLIINILGIFLFDINSNYIILIKLFSNIMLILIGLYILDLFKIILLIENTFLYTWNIILLLIKKINPSRSLFNALIFGFFWGYIPCGLVYSTVLWTLGSKSLLDSLLLIIFFGIGTLPSMMFTTIFGIKYKNLFSNNILKKLSGVLLIIFAIINITLLFKIKNCH